MHKQTIAERLKEARLKVGLSLSEVYERTGISTGNLSELEKGKHDPSAKALILFSEIYNVSVDWILKGETVGKLDKPSGKTNEFKGFLKTIEEAWEKADEETRGWIIVQLRRAFPDFNDQTKK